MMVLSNTQTTFEVQFTKKLSNTEAEMKKSVPYEKKRVASFLFPPHSRECWNINLGKLAIDQKNFSK